MTQVSRRFFLGTASLLPLAVLTFPPLAIAQTASLDVFMAVSQKLTKRNDLDRQTGQRYLAALEEQSPEVIQALGDLDRVLKSAPALEAAMVSGGLLPPPTQTAAHKIMQAWYTGQVGKKVIAYETALMYGAMGSNVIYIRTYCPDEPSYWAKKPIISG